jgi:Aldehyde dehydrogenase family
VAEAAGRHLKRVVPELGGHNPLLVPDDTDLDHAVDANAFGVSGSSAEGRHHAVAGGAYSSSSSSPSSRSARGSLAAMSSRPVTNDSSASVSWTSAGRSWRV